MALSEEQHSRFVRNILLKQIGEGGQERLAKSRALVIGAGGLGSAAAFYCVAAGVGTLGIIDHDRIELSNLQRQILHSTADVGRPKVESAAQKLRALNPDTHIVCHGFHLDESSAEQCLSQYDFIIDGTDNFNAKFLINDICVRLGKPFSHAGVEEFRGQTMTVLPRKSACYRCVFGQTPDRDSAESGVQRGIFGAVAGTLGTIQATECIKYLCGAGQLLTNRLLVYDAETMQMRTAEVKRRPDCQACAG
jgi:adenylyltransferase/sulfurtransferase